MRTPTLRIHAAGIRYFDAVRRAGSIRGAARQLNVASSAVNRQILNLEAELGTELFNRLPAGLQLTAAGEIVARHVIAVLRDGERAVSELDALQDLRLGHVELATLEGLCHRIAPAAITALHRRTPRVTVRTAILATSQIPGAVINGDAHLGLAFEVRRQPELRQIAMARFRLGAVVLPDSPLAGKSSVTLHDCAAFQLILPNANFANRDQLHPIFFESQMAARGRYEASSIELMKQLVLAGLGVAFMTRIGIETDLDTGRLAHVPLRLAGRPVFSELGLYARAATALPIAAEALVQHFVELLENEAS